ncbi:MAG TPA: hypothetical protein VK149_12175 [Sideroxyarcus sp.]|nr:hypothetical protein [Sideroxyarcus sp.]
MTLTPEFEADIRRRVNPAYVNQLGTESYERAALLGEIDRLRSAIQQTLDENGHLADGENCTLIVLKRAVGEWMEARNAPVTGMFGIAERNALIKAENALERAFDIHACKRCGGAMQAGQAIAQTFAGSHDLGDVCTLSPGGSGKLVECMKCKQCGWSVTA